MSLWEQIMSSIEEIGQIHPPVVNEDEVLLIGRHRMEALRRSTVLDNAWFLMVRASGDDVELAQIDEDLCRRQIPIMEQCEMPPTQG